MSSPFHADMQDALTRMVVPMRREFGFDLDVQQMRRDRAYAEAIVEQALGSQVQSLRDFARLIAYHLGTTPAPPEPARRSPPAAGATGVAPVHHDAALAARLLIDLVGPMGEALAIRIERAPMRPRWRRWLAMHACASPACTATPPPPTTPGRSRAVAPNRAPLHQPAPARSGCAAPHAARRASSKR